MYGAIIGDIVGSRFEFNNILSKDFAFMTPQCYFTDDTVMTCAVAQALMDSKEDFSDLEGKAVSALRSIGQKYPNCGYGARFIDWMFADHPQPYNSCGNGSAMRVSPVGFAARSMEEAKQLSAAVTKITHNHPEGMKAEMEKYYTLDKSVDDYRHAWDGHGREICQVSVPQALACFFEGESFEDVIRNCISIGGDSDTIAAIAGGIAEAFFGISNEDLMLARGYLDERLLKICDSFFAWLDR